MTCHIHAGGHGPNLLLALNAANPKAGQVPKEVVAYVTDRKAKPTETYTDVWKEEHAAAFAVARAGEVSLVESMQDAVRDALTEGLPFKEFQKRITPTLQDRGWWGKREDGAQLGSPHRLKIIYDTNIRTARAAGQWRRIQETKAALPYLRYRHGNPQRPRPDHESWDTRVLPVDHPFWTVAMPPNGYLCTCWVEQVTRSDARKSGITPDDDIDMEPIEVENPRTGQKTTTIRGIDPTFAFNAGIARMEGLKQAGVIKTRTPRKAPVKAAPVESLAVRLARLGPAPGPWPEVLERAHQIIRQTGDLPKAAALTLIARAEDAPEDALERLQRLRPVGAPRW